jgi:glycosyltransferase involved in cell wall biosynthesis
MLRKAIQSIQRLERTTDIVVHDNGSDDAATLAILDDLEGEGFPVYRNAPIEHPDQLNQVNNTVSRYFREREPGGRYVVSDCDIDLAVAHPRALHIYDELLDLFPDLDCVGPMLRISDIPRTYPLYNWVMNRHIEQFWGKVPEWITTSAGLVAFQRAHIDTTFALHRENTHFQRLKYGLRVYEPYEALHMDWYLPAIGSDPYATTSSPAISHWNNVAEYDRHQAAELQHRFCYLVQPDGYGRLVVVQAPVDTLPRMPRSRRPLLCRSLALFKSRPRFCQMRRICRIANNVRRLMRIMPEVE